MDVTPLAAQVIERRQFEIDQYRIALTTVANRVELDLPTNEPISAYRSLI